MPSKGKNKGKNKGKGKGKGKNKPHHGGGRKQRGGQQTTPNKGKKNTAKHKQHQEQEKILQTKMIEHIDAMYKEHTHKHPDMRTFFGIFTKHNQLQLRDLMKASIPDINHKLNDKFIKSTQNENNRDINQFS